MSDVLIVDDGDDIRQLTRLLLESAGHAVREAATAEAAVAAVSARPPDVLLLDLHLNLHGGEGWSVLDLLAERHLLDATRVVLFTAEVGAAGGEGRGRDRVAARLTKPFTVRELLACLES